MQWFCFVGALPRSLVPRYLQAMINLQSLAGASSYGNNIIEWDSKCPIVPQYIGIKDFSFHRSAVNVIWTADQECLPARSAGKQKPLQ